jgi:DNA-binding MarR family transcriptional regulator
MSQIIRDITEITRVGAQYRTDSLAPYGLKACHASYLSEICDCPGISQDKLAARICINKSNVARQAAALEEGGFINRCCCDKDKRIMRLYPTEKTLRLMLEIDRIMYSWQDLLTQDLSETEQELLTSMLQKMKSRAVGYMEE